MISKKIKDTSMFIHAHIWVSIDEKMLSGRVIKIGRNIKQSFCCVLRTKQLLT